MYKKLIRKVKKEPLCSYSIVKGNKYSYKKLVYPASLIIILILFFLSLEIKFPYYFLHDDNRIYWLPSIVYNYNSILNGEIPLYNFHQFLGYPWLANGQTMVLYPVGYITTFLSILIFGHYFATIDIFIIIHLLMGSLAFYILLKYIKLNDKSSFFGAITWVLSGFIIYSSTAWAFIPCFALYFPLMIYFCLKLYNNFSYGTFVWLVICRVLLFMVGHPQYYVYSIIFEILTFALVLLFNKASKDKAKLFKTIKVYMYSYIFTIILSSPLLLPMWHQMNISADRSIKLSFAEFVAYRYDLKYWIRGLLIPFSKSGDWGFLYVLKYSSYIGYFTVLFIVGCIFKYFKGRFSRNKRILISTFLITGCIAFLWMTSNLFNHIIYLFPILNRFRWPFKIEFFVNFYLIILASIGLNSFINKIGKNIAKMSFKRVAFIALIAIHIFSFYYLYMFTPRRTYQEYLIKVPLTEPLKNQINNGRMLGIKGYSCGFVYECSDFIGASYATLWGLYHFAGYEPLISKENNKACLDVNEDAVMYLYQGLWNNNKINDRISYLRQWGVKWYILNKESLFQKRLPFEKVYEDKKRVAYYDEQAKPFFFWNQNNSNNGIEYNITSNTIRLKVNNSKEDYLNINFLYNKFFKAYLNDKETKITKNDFGQMMICVPQGEHNIIIKYKDPYFMVACYVSLTFILFVSILMYIKKVKSE